MPSRSKLSKLGHFRKEKNTIESKQPSLVFPLIKLKFWAFVFLKWANSTSFSLFLFFSNTSHLKKMFRPQRDSDSDRQSRRRACWPLHHPYHLSFPSIKVLADLLLKRLFRMTEQVGTFRPKFLLEITVNESTISWLICWHSGMSFDIWV